MTTPHTEAASRRASYIQEEKLSQTNSAEEPKDLEAYDAGEKPTTDVAEVGGAPNKPTDEKYQKLTWLRLTSVLIVEAIALGS